MIERDPYALTECGIHMRSAGGFGTHACPACRSLVEAARTEPLTPRRVAKPGRPKVDGARDRTPKVGGQMRFGAKVVMPSERLIAIRSKTGGAR